MSDLTEAEVKARIAQLRKARDSGVLTFRHGDTSTTFRSLEELERTLALLEGELRGTPRRRTPGYIYQSGKGL